MKPETPHVIVIGAGLAGLMAALTIAEQGVGVYLVSRQPSERAQSVLAEGGINAALDQMGEGDSAEIHFQDTWRAGGYLGDPEAISGLVRQAPALIETLCHLGVPFHREKGKLIQRAFGGQSKKRTLYAQSSTGKVLVTALADAVRKYEASGVVHRLPHHTFLSLMGQERAEGAWIQDDWSGEVLKLKGVVLMACGGLNGLFPHQTTGSNLNTGQAVATLLDQGVKLANLEMIQFHPTTIALENKRCLISEAARGEGGRLFVEIQGKPYYFLEEKYPEYGNLMPRDVVSREIESWLKGNPVLPNPVSGFQLNQPTTVYLDLTQLPDQTWQNKLSDLRREVLHYTQIDVAQTPLPVAPAIHYFMGGIAVDREHRTSLQGLYAAGECCAQYHGANRLGGNSLLGALYGGQKAAETILKEKLWTSDSGAENGNLAQAGSSSDNQAGKVSWDCTQEEASLSVQPNPPVSEAFRERVGKILSAGLGIIREETTLAQALTQVEELPVQGEGERQHKQLAQAMVQSALLRRESRGAHYRRDYPQTDPLFQRMTQAQVKGGQLDVVL